MAIGLTQYLTVAAILFTIGVLGIFLNRKNIIIILMSVELILLAVNINFVAFSTYLGDLVGQVFALFVLTVAAAEAAIGLAILVVYFRNRGTIAVEEINDQDGQPDGGLGSGHGQHEQRKDLPHQIAQIYGKGDEVDVHRQQDQFHRHQDDDDVLAVQENAQHPDGEQDCRDGEILGEPDNHYAPSPGLISIMSTAMAAVRAFCTEITCLRTPGLDRNVSTMAPIIATSSTSPAIWK